MNQHIQQKLQVVEKAPDFLEDLVRQIPESRLEKRRIPNKWSIHEHVCHLADSQQMMIKRFQTFKNVSNPEFTPYLPGSEETSDDHLIEMDMDKALHDFREQRKEIVNLLETFTENDWNNKARHPEYVKYSPRIFLRHIMLHDHFHMYRIEQLWLTTDQYL